MGLLIDLMEAIMNLIDYNQAIEALENERQYLLNREQYGAEHILVHHALNVISELPIIRQPEIVRCKDCKHQYFARKSGDIICGHVRHESEKHNADWFCADGERERG